jgi:hypothetical protein
MAGLVVPVETDVVDVVAPAAEVSCVAVVKTALVLYWTMYLSFEVSTTPSGVIFFQVKLTGPAEVLFAEYALSFVAMGSVGTGEVSSHGPLSVLNTARTRQR